MADDSADILVKSLKIEINHLKMILKVLQQQKTYFTSLLKAAKFPQEFQARCNDTATFRTDLVRAFKTYTKIASVSGKLLEDINAMCFMLNSADLSGDPQYVCGIVEMPELPPLKPGDDLSAIPVSATEIPGKFANFESLCPMFGKKKKAEPGKGQGKEIEELVNQMKIQCAKYKRDEIVRICNEKRVIPNLM